MGQGGFGITYLAYDEALNQDVAIKEFFPATLAVRETSTQTVEFATLDGKELFEWGLKRFLEEARIMARLDNPHIVRVFQYLQLNNTGYMVMQFEKGRTLADWAMAFPEGRLPQAELLRILDPITSALDQVHQLQIAHRDLKPENILIRADGSPVIIDFGAARSTVAGKSHTVAALVTPGYSPIEQYSIAAEQGPWSDIYALGAVCYELIAGRKPAEATSRINSLQSDQFSDPCRPLLEERPHGYDTYVLRAVDQAMAIVASDRPQSVASWRAELRFGNHGDDQRRVKTPIAAPRRTTSDVGAAGKWRLAGLGLAVLAIAVAVGFSTYQLLAPDDGGSLDDRLRATFNIPRTVGSISSQPAPIKQPTTPRNEAKQDGAIEVKLEMELQKAREEREKLEQLREQAEAERQQREAEEERRRAADRERLKQLDQERVRLALLRQQAETERKRRDEEIARQREEEEQRRAAERERQQQLAANARWKNSAVSERKRSEGNAKKQRLASEQKRSDGDGATPSSTARQVWQSICLRGSPRRVQKRATARTTPRARMVSRSIP